MPALRIATRGSELALAQAEYVEKRLQELGYQTEKIIIKTTGDVNLAPFALAAGDERKGLFTKEIEDALLAGQADIAVHSYKDLPSVSLPELMIGAVPQRLDSRDYLLFLKSKRVQDFFPYVPPDATIGTSSVRRRSQLKALFPGIRVQELRGNVPTRVKKLFEEEGPDAVLLSGGGVQRLIETGRFVSEKLFVQLEIVPIEASVLVPAPAQGTLAVQCRSDDEVASRALSLMHDANLTPILGVERGVLAALEGGCHLPLGIQAMNTSSGKAAGSCVEAKVYLGEEYAKTRYPRSVQFVRRHADPERLKRFLIDELMKPGGGAPVFVFGRRPRIAELERSYGLKGFGVLNPQILEGQDRSAVAKAIERSAVVALFSAEGVRTFSGSFSEILSAAAGRPTLLWAVPGRRTAELLCVAGVPAERIITGQDGTGAGVARVLLQRPEAAGGVVGLTAEEGRDEFFEVLRSAGISVERFAVYRTVRVPLTAEDIESIGDHAYLVFGSPASFRTFADSLVALGKGWSSEWRICSIGQTTSEAIREEGRRSGMAELNEPYLTAAEPDYDSVIREILGR